MRDASLLREIYMGPHINYVGNAQLCLCLTRHITAALLQGLWSLRMRFRSSKVSTSEDLFSETIKPWKNRAFSHMLHGGFDLMTSCRAMFWSCFSQCLQWNACRKWFGSHRRWSLAGDKGAWRSKVQVHQSVAHDENPILWNLAESRVFLPLVSTCAMRGTAPSKASETSGTKDWGRAHELRQVRFQDLRFVADCQWCSRLQ